MPHRRRPEPAPADGPGGPHAVQAAVRARPACPACGREPAVVFPLLAAGAGPRPDAAPLVCLDCCPKDAAATGRPQ